MKALLKKASDWNYYKNIEINKIEDILKIDERIIIERDNYTLYHYKEYNKEKKYKRDFEIVITIYDDYIE